MFGSKKRPWKDYARIERIELNNGDVEYWTEGFDGRASATEMRGTFQTLDAAVAHLDAWYADWWPKQVKHTRRA